jgi:hypothetical protein
MFIAASGSIDGIAATSAGHEFCIDSNCRLSAVLAFAALSIQLTEKMWPKE